MKLPKPRKSTDVIVWPQVRWLVNRERWLVDARIGHKGEGGKRYYFTTRKEAEDKAVELRVLKKKHGIDALAIPPALRNEFLACNKRLIAYGKTLTDATNYYLAYLESKTSGKNWDELVAEFLKVQKDDGASDRYLEDLRTRLPVFSQAVKGKTLSEIKKTDVEEWLKGLKIRRTGEAKGRPVSATTRANFRRLLAVAFSYAVDKDYCLTNPATIKLRTKKAEKRKRAKGELTATKKAKRIGVLHPEEIEAILTVAASPVIPYLVLAAFAGVRRCELVRLDWSEIRLEKMEIYIPEEVSKTFDRTFKIEPMLCEWLKPFERAEGYVTPENYRILLDDARKAARRLLLEKRAEHTLASWPNNCLRHSYASYWYAKFQDVGALQNTLGHTNPNLIFSTYREAVPAEAGDAYWNILPKKVPTSICGGTGTVSETTAA